MFCGTYAKQVSEVEGTRKHNPREAMKKFSKRGRKKTKSRRKKSSVGPMPNMFLGRRELETTAPGKWLKIFCKRGRKENQVPAEKVFPGTYARHVFGTQGVGKKYPQGNF